MEGMSCRGGKMLRYECLLELVCPACGKIIMPEVVVPEPMWNENWGVRDLASKGPVTIVCSECKTELEALVEADPRCSKFTLVKYPDTRIRSTPPSFIEFEDWNEYDPPEDPYNIFIDSLQLTEDLLNEHGGGGSHLVNRMVFAHRISALEAYLADTVINAVTTDKAALGALLGSNRLLAGEKHALAEIYMRPDFVRTRVLTYLREIQWHRLDVAREMYRPLFDLDLYEVLGEEKKALLFRAVEYRHDCVHRNGYDANKKRLEVFTKEYIAEVGEAIKALVQRIQAQVDFGKKPIRR